MQVETFECAETAAEPIEATEEAIEIIKSLNLAGQKKFIDEPESGGEHAKRSPYREIRKDERFVYRTLCPESTLVSDYDSAPIPLRVLQIAAHASKFFRHLKVWHQPAAEVKDPVLVATNNSYEWEEGNTFILARWGEELESFPVLMQRAIKTSRERLIQSARKVLTEVESATDEEVVSKGANSKIQW